MKHTIRYSEQKSCVWRFPAEHRLFTCCKADQTADIIKKYCSGCQKSVEGTNGVFRGSAPKAAAEGGRSTKHDFIDKLDITKM